MNPAHSCNGNGGGSLRQLFILTAAISALFKSIKNQQ